MPAHSDHAAAARRSGIPSVSGATRAADVAAAPMPALPKPTSSARANPVPVPQKTRSQETRSATAIVRGWRLAQPLRSGRSPTSRAQIGSCTCTAAPGRTPLECSGLTVRAWQAGGVSLTYTAKAQRPACRTETFPELGAGLTRWAWPAGRERCYSGAKARRWLARQPRPPARPARDVDRRRAPSRVP